MQQNVSKSKRILNVRIKDVIASFYNIGMLGVVLFCILCIFLKNWQLFSTFCITCVGLGVFDYYVVRKLLHKPDNLYICSTINTVIIVAGLSFIRGFIMTMAMFVGHIVFLAYAVISLLERPLRWFNHRYAMPLILIYVLFRLILFECFTDQFEVEENKSYSNTQRKKSEKPRKGKIYYFPSKTNKEDNSF